ncbi:MAG: hypothetical protein ACYC8T_27145 [Myxococcaceae bacterium]
MSKSNLTSETVPAFIAQALQRLGQNIAVARRRRRLRQRDLAAKAGVSLLTMNRVEKGNPTTAIAAYLAALWALGLEAEFADIAPPDRDEEGKTLERARQPARVTPGRELSDEF